MSFVPIPKPEMTDTIKDSAFTTNAQLFDLLKKLDNAIGDKEQLSASLEAFQATIDMQTMIALYAKENVQRLRTERGEDPRNGPSAKPTSPQFYKDMAESKTWAISTPLAEFFSKTSWSNHSENHWSEMESWGDVNIDPKSFFKSVKDRWIKLQGVEGAIEQLVQEFFRVMADEKPERATLENLPQVQQCISISNLDEKAILGPGEAHNEANVSYQPTVSVLYLELELKSWKVLTKQPFSGEAGVSAGSGNQGQHIKAEIRVYQSSFEAKLNLEAIRSSKARLQANRKKMIDMGLNEFEKLLTAA